MHKTLVINLNFEFSRTVGSDVYQIFHINSQVGAKMKNHYGLYKYLNISNQTLTKLFSCLH